MEDRQELLRKELLKQREELVNEVNNLESQLKFKREYLMKVVGGLETIELLFGPNPEQPPAPESAEEQETTEE